MTFKVSLKYIESTTKRTWKYEQEKADVGRTLCG